MKKATLKHTIIIGFISILGLILVTGGYIFSDITSRAHQSDTDPIEKKVSFIKNVPTEKELNQQSAKAKQVTIANTVKDTTAPIINAPEETIEQDAPVDVFEDVTATDNNDGDITDKVATDETIDTSIIGTQTIHLTVADTSGNSSDVERLFHIVPKSEPLPEEVSSVQTEEPVPAAAEPVVTTTESEPETQTAPAYSPMTITMAGQTIPYQNGGQSSGQSVIDSDPAGIASTWGGAAVQSGDDGQNTHFIGHNPGAFSSIFSLGVGSQIVVTDGNGTPTTYTVRTLLQLDDYGKEVGTGTNYWDLIVGTDGGERISLQSCVNDDINLFAIAYK